ncbi:hypothetical protein [Granulibacter bethesdensis]|uniref:hypothetical protein n=1 Tax=Granulibacter bethesdensis TaxID=364410 RepID=UPI0003F1DD8F|nr:hypothetical protein [Granulibacter bethesdensis]AHJ67539.1 putative membrane spanning protein [Granulibacter bethesdensis]
MSVPLSSDHNTGLRPAPLLALALISGAAVGYETALTRYFAVAKWSEYGYWVISIVMAGLALSGVATALARQTLTKYGTALQAILPLLLLPAAVGGYLCVTANPFNPLQLQNPATYGPQLWLIGLYYAALLPFFFLTGLYISLSFILGSARLGKTYGYDLAGAGGGALLVLVLMQYVHPFQLMPCMLPLLLLACWLAGSRLPPRLRAAHTALALLLFATGIGALHYDSAAFNDFKPIYAPLHVEGARMVQEVDSPRGLYNVLADFTERVDTDISNDAGMLNLPGPPRTLGVYRDGNRIAALPLSGPGQPGLDARYAPAALNALPYILESAALKAGGQVLLIGSGGGFRIAEAKALGAAHVTALEPDPILRKLMPGGFELSGANPVGVARRHPATFAMIDVSSDFLDEQEANAHVFTRESLDTLIGALAPGGVLSLPVSIREFPAYAVRLLATVRDALRARGVDPMTRVIVYRSAWNLRILVSNQPFSAGTITTARHFADQRSFDVPYFPGIDLQAAKASIYNDLPPVSFEDGSVGSGSGPADAVAEEALPVLSERDDADLRTGSQRAFNLSPITEDRPFFYSVLRLSHLGTILQRLEMLPQQEIGPLVNLAVLAQAALLAMIVLVLPMIRPRRIGMSAGGTARAVAYFAVLGLGFLFIEIVLIDKAAFWLNDRATAFAAVLSMMLIFSGIGAMLSGRFTTEAARTLRIAAGLTIVWCAAILYGLPALVLNTLDWPIMLRLLLLGVVLAPVSILLGLFFPLGLNGTPPGLLPWAWGVNGAFSVVATPLANLLALQKGYSVLLIGAAMLYGLAALLFHTPSATRAEFRQGY